MRKSNWIVTAIAAVACGVLLWAWFALGFNHVDDPLAREGRDIANDPRGLRPKGGFGASFRWFATQARSARGTDRDIPASFLRSRSSRVGSPSMKQGGSHERRHARVQRLAHVRSFDDG